MTATSKESRTSDPLTGYSRHVGHKKWYLPFYTSDLMVVYNTTYKLFEVFCIHICRFYTPSACISELFCWPTFGDIWPFVSASTVTQGSKPMVPFERPYSSSYLPPIDIFGLSRSISELFRWHTFGDLWPFIWGQPWPRGQPKWYHSKGHTHFPIWLPLTLFAYLVPFLR